MHIDHTEFARGQVTLTVDYRTNEGARRVTVTFTGDDAGILDCGEAGAPARDKALKLLTDFVNTASGDLKAKRIRWRGI